MGDYEMMMSEADNIMDRVWLADRDRAGQERINWDLEGPDEEGETNGSGSRRMLCMTRCRKTIITTPRRRNTNG